MQRTCQRKVCKEVKLVTRDFYVIYVCLNVSGNAAIKNVFFGLFILCSNDCAHTLFFILLVYFDATIRTVQVYLSSNTRERKMKDIFD